VSPAAGVAVIGHAVSGNRTTTRHEKPIIDLGAEKLDISPYCGNAAGKDHHSLHTRHTTYFPSGKSFLPI
jgi:hypothetical protein